MSWKQRFKRNRGRIFLWSKIDYSALFLLFFAYLEWCCRLAGWFIFWFNANQKLISWSLIKEECICVCIYIYSITSFLKPSLHCQAVVHPPPPPVNIPNDAWGPQSSGRSWGKIPWSWFSEVKAGLCTPQKVSHVLRSKRDSVIPPP